MNVLIIRNDTNKDAIEASYLLSAYLTSNGIDFTFVEESDLYAHKDVEILKNLQGKQIDMAVVLGGDGAILQTARLLSDYDVAILGINFGHLGFLANDGAEGCISLVGKAFAGELREEARTNLMIEVTCDEDAPSAQETLNTIYSAEAHRIGVDLSGLDGCRTFFALNEASVERGEFGRMLDLSLDISGTHIANIRGNGIIVASATGSTAYSLGAGGPLVNPHFRGLIVQPIAPHTLVSRAILADSNDIVSIDVRNSENADVATLFADGNMLVFDKPIVQVKVKRGERPTRLLYESGEHFYQYAAEKFYL